MTANQISWIAFVLLGMNAITVHAAAPVTQPAPAMASPFDPDPKHLWNRLHDTLLVRTILDGQQVGDDLFPYLWTHTRFVLKGTSHAAAIAVLDEFLAAHGEKLIGDPGKRLMLQRDLWAVFDWCAWVPDEWVHYKVDEPAAVALRVRLAKCIHRLALSSREIAALPDNYRTAVQSQAFAGEYNGALRAQPFLPPHLVEKDSAWRCFDTDRDMHANAAKGRSIFLVLIQLPGGKQATVDYLNSLSDGPRQFPVGTKVALLRQALAINDGGRVEATNVTESLQLRVFREIPGFVPNHQSERDRGGWQDCYEFNLDRRAWFNGGHGLHAVTPDEKSLLFGFGRGDDTDPFQKPIKQSRDQVEPSPLSPPAPTLRNCIECHQSPGVYSLASIQSMFDGRSPRGRTSVYPNSAAMAREQAVLFKGRRADWAMLQGMLDAAQTE